MGKKDKIKEHLFNEVIELRKKIAELKKQKFIAGKICDITKSKQIAEKFQENKKYLKPFFDAVQSGIVIIEAETHKIIDANPAAIKMIASSKKNIIGNICHNYICPNEIGKCPITDLNRKVDSSECFLLNQNGEKIPIVKNVVPITNNGNKYLIESFIDISELKKSEDILRENEEKYRNVVENSNDSICIVQDHMIKFCNQQSTNLIGYSSEEIINTSFINFIHPHELEKVVEKYTSFMAGEQDNLKFETTLIHKNGHNIIVELNVSVTNYNGDRAALVFIRDISDHKKAEEELKKTKSHLEFLVSSVPSVIYSCETHGDFAPTYVSENLVRVLGYTTEEFLSDPKFWVNHIHPDDVSTALGNREKLFKKDSMIQEYRFLHKNGSYLWLSDDCTPIRDQKGNPVEIVGSFINITDKKSLEEQFHQSQKMEAVGRLAGGIAHDFNNLLQTIIGYCDFLLLEYEDKEQNQQDLKQIKKAGNRAASLIKQLLTFSRKQSVQPIFLNLNVVISDLSKMLKRLIGEDIELKTILDSNLNTIKADQTHMEQIIMNLVVNARDAMPKGGKLTIRTENVILEENDCHNISDARPGEFICLSVEDQGIGIDPIIMDHIFEPFFSTKKKGEGTGLGLPTVYGIVKQHEGWIIIDSNHGKGTTFKIYMPSYFQKSEDKFYGNVSLADLKGNEERILIVEDETGVREFTKRALRNAGYILFDASSVQEALNIIKREKGKFDLLLSDVVLPDQSGLVLMHQLKILNPCIKIIFSSGYTDQKSQWKIIHTEGIDFIQKPYSLIKLLQSIKNSLESSLIK